MYSFSISFLPCHAEVFPLGLVRPKFPLVDRVSGLRFPRLLFTGCTLNPDLLGSPVRLPGILGRVPGFHGFGVLFRRGPLSFLGLGSSSLDLLGKPMGFRVFRATGFAVHPVGFRNPG